jgi:hypothetical protein
MLTISVLSTSGIRVIVVFSVRSCAPINQVTHPKRMDWVVYGGPGINGHRRHRWKTALDYRDIMSVFHRPWNKKMTT